MCAQRRLRSAWASTQSDQPSLWAQWVAKDPSFLHADNEDSDQTGRMPSLIWVFAGRTLILWVLSCRGSDFLNFNKRNANLSRDNYYFPVVQSTVTTNFYFRVIESGLCQWSEENKKMWLIWFYPQFSSVSDKFYQYKIFNKANNTCLFRARVSCQRVWPSHHVTDSW